MTAGSASLGNTATTSWRGKHPGGGTMAAGGTVLPFVRGIDLTKNDFKVRNQSFKFMSSLWDPGRCGGHVGAWGTRL